MCFGFCRQWQIYEITPGNAKHLASGVKTLWVWLLTAQAILLTRMAPGTSMFSRPRSPKYIRSPDLTGPIVCPWQRWQLFVGLTTTGIYEFTANGAAAPSLRAEPFGPLALAVDNAGDVFYGDRYWVSGISISSPPMGRAASSRRVPEGLASARPEPHRGVMVAWASDLFLSGLRSRRRSS